MLPLEKGRQLFMFFAERMQPHSFGFPTFPPTENVSVQTRLGLGRKKLQPAQILTSLTYDR